MLKVEYVPLESIKPYKRNAKKHPPEQIEQIKKSIQEFGFKDPIGIWRNEIVEGHGRYFAARELGMDTVPIIRLDDLTDDQRKAYTLAHNKLTMNTDFDVRLLDIELDEISLDMEQFGFEIATRAPAENHTDRELDLLPRLQHNTFDNFEREFTPEWAGKYDIPVIEPTHTVGDKFSRFCDWREVEDPSEYIAHFFYDDYKFIASWRDPDLYVDRLREYKAVISPNYSLYTDFPLAMQIMSCYRRNWMGADWEALGIGVVRGVIGGDGRSYEFCFDGIPEGGTVAVSTVGVKRDKDWNGKDDSVFRQGYEEMMRRLHPETVLFYGDMIDGIEGNIIRIPSFYEEKRGMLNERLKEKKNGKRNERET